LSSTVPTFLPKLDSLANWAISSSDREASAELRSLAASSTPPRSPAISRSFGVFMPIEAPIIISIATFSLTPSFLAH
jgi:hypothetical protein